MSTAATPTTTKPMRLYASFDIEADGSSPAQNSMLSFGLVLFDSTGKEIDKLQINLKPRVGAEQEKRCMDEFWAKNPEVWKFVQTDAQEPQEFGTRVAALLVKYKDHRVTWVANPAAYDWQWVKFYYELYKPVGAPDIGYSAKCIGTLYWTWFRIGSVHTLMLDDEDLAEQQWMQKLKAPGHMDHNPEHDARVQGRFFFELCEAVMGKFGINAMGQ
jgi:hypothetical protein